MRFRAGSISMYKCFGTCTSSHMYFDTFQKCLLLHLHTYLHPWRDKFYNAVYHCASVFAASPLSLGLKPKYTHMALSAPCLSASCRHHASCHSLLVVCCSQTSQMNCQLLPRETNVFWESMWAFDGHTIQPITYKDTHTYMTHTYDPHIWGSYHYVKERRGGRQLDDSKGSGTWPSTQRHTERQEVHLGKVNKWNQKIMFVFNCSFKSLLKMFSLLWMVMPHLPCTSARTTKQ